MALQSELEKRIAKDSEAIVFEQEARKFFLAWRQVGARRDEHAKVCSLCWPLLVESQHWAAVANVSRLYAKRTRVCPEFGHRSIQMQPTPPEFYADADRIFSRIRPSPRIWNPHLSRIQMQPKLPTFHANATFFLCRIRPNYIHNAIHFGHDFGQHSIDMQPKPSEFHANIGGGTADKEGACVEVVHTWVVSVWRRSTHRGSMCMCGGSPHMEGACVEDVHT